MSTPDPSAKRVSGEQRLEALLEHSSDMIGLHDRVGTITYVSPSTTHWLGYRPADLVLQDSLKVTATVWYAATCEQAVVFSFGKAVCDLQLSEKLQGVTGGHWSGSSVG